MYPCDPISFNSMKIRGEASYYYAEIKEFVKDLCLLTDFILEMGDRDFLDFTWSPASVENKTLMTSANICATRFAHL